MKTMWLIGAMVVTGCGLGTGSSDLQVGADDVGGEEECDGGLHDDDEDGGCGGEPDLPYDVKIQCGDDVIPVVAAFREKNGDEVRFAPAPGSTPDCPFVIEGAVIRASEVAACQAFTATEADAAAPGNKDTGRDRVEVTWCWYTDLDAGDDGSCCVPEAAGSNIECETDHLDIRFYCDGGEGVPDGAAAPLDPAATPDACEGGGGGGDGGGDDGGDGDDGEDDCSGCPDDGGGDDTADPVD